MLALLLLAAITAAEPFPVDHAGNADLARLRDAWLSPATNPAQRGVLDQRIRDAAARPSPDWRAVADGYFDWRNAAATADNAHGQHILYLNRRAAGSVRPAPSSVCTTETRSEPGLYGVTRSSSKTTCY